MSILTEIRTAKPSEQELLGELHRRSSYVWEDDRANLEAHPDALGIAYEAIVDGRVRVAVGQARRLVGFSVVVYAADGVCELDDLFVDPDVIRRGIGRELVEDAAARACAAGCREMTVVAHPRNFAFYGSVQFIPGEPVTTRFGPATRLRRALDLRRPAC